MYYLIFVALVVVILLILWRPSSVRGYCSEDDPYKNPIVIDNLIKKEEADHIIEVAKTKFNSSTILSGSNESIRKSETAWIGRKDPIIKDVFERLSKRFDFILDNTEDLQVVRYMPGGYYNDHHDSCCDDTQHCRDFIKKSGQRVLTILIYLNDEFEAGHTNFPKLNLNLKADKYGGIVFNSLESGGSRCHPKSLHKGTPVTSGVKYVCNIWVREKKWY